MSARNWSRLERHFDKITNVQVIDGGRKLKQKIEATLRIAGGEIVIMRNMRTCTRPSTC